MSLKNDLENHYPRLTAAQKECILNNFDNATRLNLRSIEAAYGKKFAARFKQKSNSPISSKTAKKYYPLLDQLPAGYHVILLELPNGKLVLSREDKALTLVLYTWQ